MAYEYECLKVDGGGGVVTVAIDNPPVNVMTLPLFGELLRFGQEVASDDDVRVVVLKSANPEFFIAHFDVEAILQLPTEGEAHRKSDNVFHQLCERFRTMDKVTIAQIEGRVGGGGSELVQAFDMRFGVRGDAVVCQMEVPIGILPGGGGTQRLPRMLGRGRALELILSGEDLDAETAERWGFFNRIFEPSEIDGWVQRLAHRIASFPPEAVRLAKQAVDCAALPLAEGLVEEAFLFDTLLRTDEAKRRMRLFLEKGGQTREGELAVGELLDALASG